MTHRSYLQNEGLIFRWSHSFYWLRAVATEVLSMFLAYASNTPVSICMIAYMLFIFTIHILIPFCVEYVAELAVSAPFRLSWRTLLVTTMPICTSCTHPISYLYTVYESAYNLRLEQCVSSVATGTKLALRVKLSTFRQNATPSRTHTSSTIL